MANSQDNPNEGSVLRISVVLPTYNRLDRLRRVLDALAQQTLPCETFEVIVVSDGSTDGTNAFLERLETPFCLRPIFQENGGVAVARNAGLAWARAPFVLFVDDDVVPDPDLLAAHLRRHDGLGKPAVVIGPMLTPADFPMPPWVRWEQAMLTKQYEAMIEGAWQPTARQFYTGNSSLPRRQLQESGGFDGRFRRAEDVELAYRLAGMGLSFFFAPEAIGYHFAERSFSSWQDIAYAYGRNDVIFTLEKGQTWLLPTVFKEFKTRHQLIRLLVRLGLDRPSLSAAAFPFLRGAASLFSRLGSETGARFCLSGIYNLRYYQGICDQLGGRARFFEMAGSGRGDGR